MFTVIDLIRAHGKEPEDKVAVIIGARLRDRFQEEYGEPPTKDLRTKTSGSGSHCFAVYPDSFRATALAFVGRELEELKAVETAQGDLFR